MVEAKTIEKRRGPKFIREGGRLWFSKETERQVCFILTLIMLFMGILYKAGII